ncbi:CIA30 family protein [Dokdonia sp. Hel_I_53]|uniref:CIA30 family protein n=1 Tax=Dokdonia sp. Hel_I_53 TaxID=1566287 RepID=UPI001199E48E|nr:CIA30 family protein [Dokdonia sp. Hel_I_53]TVZ53182.1 complex I intermediate-associated protein 30 (CIA30) [Dokdonia sp. Hel_I_53]
MSKNNTEVQKNNSSEKTLYSFPEQGQGKWRVQDDVVMGGRSDSNLKLTDNKVAHFSGHVSLKNNGGFCSIHMTTENEPYVLSETLSAFKLVVMGDGKDYTFRVRTPNGRHSYGFTFKTNTTGNWESITIPFDKMKAKFRGEPVEVPNYKGENILEMQLLIGNKKEENFEIFIKSIAVQ